jgi:hypothetical protein
VPTRAEIDRLDGATTDVISNRVRTVAAGTVAVAWAFLIGDMPQTAPKIAAEHLFGITACGLLAVFLDYLQYFFKYRALAVHRQRLHTRKIESGETHDKGVLIASCGDTELRLLRKNAEGTDDQETNVEWDVRLPSYRVAHALFWWKQVFVSVSVCWLLVVIGLGILSSTP